MWPRGICLAVPLLSYFWNVRPASCSSPTVQQDSDWAPLWNLSFTGNQVPLNADRGTEQAIDRSLDRLDRLDGDVEADIAVEAHQVLHAMINAVSVMQDHFFEVWLGTWPSAIDWTAAVMGTQVSGAMLALTRSPLYEPHDSSFGRVNENTIAGYFSHISSFYFGEDAFALRLQAYDDMLWVVLGWLEAVQLIQAHSDRHFPHESSEESTWYAKHFIPAFAHRARLFWALAHKGWDTTLCEGGMIWNPYLTPYKNAITNQLYISASVQMYLYFPGDNNRFPFFQSKKDGFDLFPLPPVEPHDRKYLDAAIIAYDWLAGSGMMNSQGLFVDGFHIAGWRGGPDGSNGTARCDVRNEMVYTYNQGVILTGQRGLWRATGNDSYLAAGHTLVSAVIAATGYRDDGAHFPGWCGLGRRGVLEDQCDSTGGCSQDGQTFKGIFFHHFATFCAPLPLDGDGEVFFGADPATALDHARRCASYTPWLARNARAACGTRDSEGRFGGWWTPGLGSIPGGEAVEVAEELEKHSEDYRNQGVPQNSRWQVNVHHMAGINAESNQETNQDCVADDPNRCGRGRTVETQSGGVAVLKALYALVERPREGKDKQ